MRVLQIGSDRSRRGVMVRGSEAYARQKAYADALGVLDIIGFSLRRDGFLQVHDENLHVHPTSSISRLFYGLDALFIATKLPWPDVVTAQDPFEAGLTALIISGFVRRPLHVNVHTDFLSPEYAASSVLNRLRVIIAGFVLRRASRVRVVSERVKISIEKLYGIRTPVRVLPIFTDIDAIRSQATPDELRAKFARYARKLLYVGRLEHEKHPCLALRAFAEATSHDACLIVVGTGSEAAYLRELADKLAISDRVFFEGEKDSVPYYALADLILVTSRYEGYGMVIIEALAAGKPVLSTDVGIAREAGAILAAEQEYPAALRKWFKEGPFSSQLASHPYESFEKYAAAYASELRATLKPI